MEEERAQAPASRDMVEKDIAHIKMILPMSLTILNEEQPLDSAYWRRRLFRILRHNHLSMSDLRSVDVLLAVLDRFDAEHL
jgi:hypothetical protein